MLNNQPMGFYHPSTLVKDAQRHGVRFAPIDVQVSDWPCRVEADGRLRLGLMYVNGLRRETGEAIAAASAVRSPMTDDRCALPEQRCPKCGCDDPSMLETLHTHEGFCNVCSHLWTLPVATSIGDRSSAIDHRTATPRFETLDQLIRRCGLRRDEVATLARIGALNAFGFDRRTALWQIEQAVRPAGELFEEDGGWRMKDGKSRIQDSPTSDLQPPTSSPLRPMSVPERLLADYAGTSLTIGPHPMSLRRQELALRGVLRARDLPSGRHGRRVRVAGAVITRQRPGTAKGFVFLTLEDETGIANIIVRPDLFSELRSVVIGEPYLIVEGTLQIQEGVTSVKAERVQPLGAPHLRSTRATSSDTSSLIWQPPCTHAGRYAPAWLLPRQCDGDLVPRRSLCRRCANARGAGLLVPPDAGRTRCWGVCGEALATDSHAKYTVIEVKTTGFSRGLTVQDQDGRKWSAKFPPEAPTEVVASRILWAVGYHQPPVYYVGDWNAEGAPDPNPQLPARVREWALKEPHGLEHGNWSYAHNPRRHARDERLLVLQVMLGNSDLKDEQNFVYTLKEPLEGAKRWYVARDLGQSFGRTGVFEAPRGDVLIFEQTPFIDGMNGQYVKFEYHGRHHDLVDRLTPDDVRWICTSCRR
jgi:hypothetical protein